MTKNKENTVISSQDNYKVEIKEPLKGYYINIVDLETGKAIHGEYAKALIKTEGSKIFEDHITVLEKVKEEIDNK